MIFKFPKPRFNRVYYWIDGDFYVQHGYFGCQIQSIRWFRPPAGTELELLGRKFRIYRTRRKGLRVECSWALVNLPKDLDAAHEMIRSLYRDMKRGYV